MCVCLLNTLCLLLFSSRLQIFVAPTSNRSFVTCFRHCIFIYLPHSHICLSSRWKCKINIQIYLKYPPTSLEVETIYKSTENPHLLQFTQWKIKIFSHTLNLGAVAVVAWIVWIVCAQHTSFTNGTIHFANKKRKSKIQMCWNKRKTTTKTEKQKKCLVSSQENNVTQHWNSFVAGWISLFQLAMFAYDWTECKYIVVSMYHAISNHLTQKNASSWNCVRRFFRSLYVFSAFSFSSATMHVENTWTSDWNHNYTPEMHAFRQIPKYAIRIIKWQYAHLVVIYWIDSNMDISFCPKTQCLVASNWEKERATFWVTLQTARFQFLCICFHSNFIE